MIESRIMRKYAFCFITWLLISVISAPAQYIQDAILQQADSLLALKKYDLAEKAYLRVLNNLNDKVPSGDSADHTIVVSRLAKIYNEELQIAINERAGKQCIELYSKAFKLFSSCPKTTAGYHMYFGPLNDRIRDIVALIPSDSISPFCDNLIDLDQIIAEADIENGKEFDIDPMRYHAAVIGNAAMLCYQNKHYAQSLEYYDKAIEYITQNEHVSWEDDLSQLYICRAITKEDVGEWLSAIEDRIFAFKFSLDSFGENTEKVQERFVSIKTSVDIATEASISFVNSIYSDSMHPHLEYEENIGIIQLWRDCLKDVIEKHGADYLVTLHNYDNRCKEELYSNLYGKPRPSGASAQLSYMSESFYKECLINIMENRLAEFTISYKKLLEGIVSFNGIEDNKILRYNVVMDLAEALSHAGYSDWSFAVLENYFKYLVSTDHADFELAEKITTQIGFAAWRMMDIDRWLWATRNAEFVANSDNHSAIQWLFYDINDLIAQLVILSRIQVYTDVEKAKSSLEFAKELVKDDIHLSNGVSISKTTMSLLYTDLVLLSGDSRTIIDYYEKALENASGMNCTTRLNLAAEYVKIGDLQRADSLLYEVYQYSKNQYMEPRWKAMLYEILTSISIKEKNYDKAQKYSQERLSIQIHDYLIASQSMTSQVRNNYWDRYYAQTLIDASSVDMACGISGSIAYNAALFQKSILIRQKQTIKDNILKSNDVELKEAFSQYNRDILSHSGSAIDAEAYCMYLYSLHPEFIGSFEIPSWKQIQSSLADDGIAIEFAIAYDYEYNDVYYVAIILRRSFDTPVIVKLCRREELVSLATLNCDEAGFSIGLYMDSTVIYNLIWKPIEKHLKGVKTIYYSPFEYLNNVNIEAACKRRGRKTVGNTYQLFRVSTTAELVYENYRHYSSAILFGDIDYDAALNVPVAMEIDNIPVSEDHYIMLRGSMSDLWGPLENTIREVEEIRTLLSRNNISTKLYTSRQGTEEAFKSLSGNAPDILHLATHGFYYTAEEAVGHKYFITDGRTFYQSGIRSGVVLASANHAFKGESIPPGIEDGILTADEICGMDLTGTDLLTLSACQTALGDIGSDGIYGMQRSFKIAGVNTIIMSLWKVDDEATYIMMDRLYQELAKGKEKHEAFRIAQSSIRVWAEEQVKKRRGELSKLSTKAQERKKVRYGGRLYPEYYWAAFVMLD